MKPIKKILSIAAIGAISVFAFNAGERLFSDVQFARAETQVTAAREDLKTLGDMAGSYKTINKAMEQSVVHILVTKNARGLQQIIPNFPGGGLPRRFFDQDGDGQPDAPDENDSPDLTPSASGSGVIMDSINGEAFIVTNNHVIEDSSKIEVVLQDGRHISEAKVVGTDPKTDVAVIKIKVEKVIPARWGDSDKLEKGDLIVAFGSPFGYVGSMSHGIVSALNRQAGILDRRGFSYENFIQVDAPINPGNSGGPLVNLNAEVVGINTAIVTRSGSFSGIGFAIPSNQAKLVYESLKNTGKIVRGYLGVQISDVKNPSPDIKALIESVGYEGESGVFVAGVLPSSPANKILRPGDVITEIDGKPVASMNELRNKIAAMPPEQEVKLTIIRDKKSEPVTIKLGEQPDDPRQVAQADSPTLTPTVGVSIATPTADELEAAGLPADAKGALVKQVRPNSPAARAGIRAGDLITRIGDADIATADEASKALAKLDLNKVNGIRVLNREGDRLITIGGKRR